MTGPLTPVCERSNLHTEHTENKTHLLSHTLAIGQRPVQPLK